MKLFKKLICIICLMLITFALNLTPNINLVYAYTNNNKTFEVVNITNGNFDYSPNTTSLDKNPSGWSKIKQSSTATSGVINVNEKDNKFSANHSEYKLEKTDNPRTISTDCDDKVLMINSTNSNNVETDASQGYRSNALTLDCYSYYEISVLVCTMKSAYASIYLTGFEDYEDEMKDISSNKFQNVKTSNNNWAEYTFFIQTNLNDISVNLELYLGPTSNYTSTGVVFFDNVSVMKVSESKFQSDLTLANNKYQTDLSLSNNAKKKFSQIEMNINYLNDYLSSEYNFNFETGQTKNSWTINENSNTSNAVSRVLKVSSSEIMQQYNVKNLGTDNSYNNNYALVLSSKENVFIGFSSKDIKINQFEIYKISLNVKCDNIIGSAYIKLIENDDVAFIYGEDEDANFYTPTTSYIQISTNPSDIIINNYTTVSFYVTGHSLYDTSVKLELCLGNENELSSGTVIFDNITVEKLSYAQLSSKPADNYNQFINFSTMTTTPTVQNGYFNNVTNQELNNSYPIEAKDWEQTTTGNEKFALWGVVNTNADIWNNNGLHLTNPKNPTIKIGETTITTPITDTNNILMIYNKTTTYQSVASPTISLSKNSYYTISFDYRTPNSISIFNLYVINENDKIVYEELNLDSNVWKNYSLLIKTEFYATELKLVFEVGNKENPAQGVVYIDNVDLETEDFSDEQYLEKVQHSNNILDLSNIGFNIKSKKKNEYEMFEALLFESDVENSFVENIALGGIIDETNIFDLDFPESNTSVVKNMLAISTFGQSTYSLTSKYQLDLSANTYYKFSIFIKTEFKEEINDDEEFEYGAEFSLIGLKNVSLKNIKSETFNEYTIYVYVDENSTVQVKFGLTSDDYSTAGNAFFDSFSFETINEKQYKDATDSDTVLVFSATDLQEESQEEENEEEAFERSGAEIWIAISSIIMAIAVILAVVLSFLRRIEIKKYQVKKPVTIDYDRAKTVSPDIVVREAKNRRDEEIKLLKQDIKELEEFLETVEEENKRRIAQHRAEFGKGITRKSERDFKTYANTRRKILKDLDKLNEKIKVVNSPEWLIQQEKLVASETTKSKKIIEPTDNKSQENKENNKDNEKDKNE